MSSAAIMHIQLADRFYVSCLRVSSTLPHKTYVPIKVIINPLVLDTLLALVLLVEQVCIRLVLLFLRALLVVFGLFEARFGNDAEFLVGADPQFRVDLVCGYHLYVSYDF